MRMCASTLTGYIFRKSLHLCNILRLNIQTALSLALDFDKLKNLYYNYKRYNYKICNYNYNYKI